MHPWLVRHLAYPLHERLLGRRTFRLLAELESSQWYTPQRLAALQLVKLRRLLRVAAERYPEYAAAAAQNGRDWADERDPRELLRLIPLSDKGTIRARERARTTARLPRGTRRMSTGGSTGEPLTFLVDRAREAYDKAARMRTHGWFGIRPGDREVYIWGAPIAYKRQEWLRGLRDVFHNDLLLSAFDLSPGTMRAYLRRIETFDPSCIFGYPSSIARLCEFARAEGRALTLGRLKVVFVTGEVLDRQQREEIESFFGVAVANGYGGRDSGFCAHQCPRGRMHVTSEHVILEIVDADGNPLPPGRSGEIVVTNLDNYATPFIRYRTGDIGRLRSGGCGCGRGLALMDVVAGRRTDHLVTSDGTYRHALSLVYDMRRIESVRQFQVRQASDRSIDVRVVADGEFSAADRERVLRGIRSCVGHRLCATLHVVDRIDTLPSGKFRHVVSEAQAGPRA